jgi:hypothetical protein
MREEFGPQKQWRSRYRNVSGHVGELAESEICLSGASKAPTQEKIMTLGVVNDELNNA